MRIIKWLFPHLSFHREWDPSIGLVPQWCYKRKIRMGKFSLSLSATLSVIKETKL